MTGDELLLGGERYLRVELVATWYEVEAGWIEELCEWGLLVRVTRRDRTLWIAADEVDRLARVVALHRHHALDLQAIALLLR